MESLYNWEVNQSSLLNKSEFWQDLTWAPNGIFDTLSPSHNGFPLCVGSIMEINFAMKP